jgi:hypothetical protein
VSEKSTRKAPDYADESRAALNRSVFRPELQLCPCHTAEERYNLRESGPKKEIPIVDGMGWRRRNAAGGQPLTMRPHRTGNSQHFFLLLEVAACFCCALDRRMAKSSCICDSCVCWSFTFHLPREKRSTLCMPFA